MKQLALLLIPAILLSLAGCELVGSENENPSSEEGNGRIVFGASIDGIEIGDDTTAVIDQLGRPDYVGIGDFPGVTFAYAYPASGGEGLRDSLEVTIITEPDSGWEYGVWTMKASGPYSGETRDGVRIGTTRERVLQLIGAPAKSQSPSDAQGLWDTYCFEKASFVLTYAQSRIRTIRMGLRCPD